MFMVFLWMFLWLLMSSVTFGIFMRDFGCFRLPSRHFRVTLNVFGYIRNIFVMLLKSYSNIGVRRLLFRSLLWYCSSSARVVLWNELYFGMRCPFVWEVIWYELSWNKLSWNELWWYDLYWYELYPTRLN